MSSLETEAIWRYCPVYNLQHFLVPNILY